VISGRSLAQGVKKLVCRAGWGKAKWERYTLLPTSPRQTDSSLRALVRLAADARPMLSANSVLARAEVRLLETLERVRADWREGRFGSPVNRSGGSVSC
jgi:hypothetical protein